MEQKIAKVQQGESKSGKTVWSFRIPNSTNDYIELSTYGCSLQGLHVHDGDGTLRGLVREMGSLKEYEAAGATYASLLGGMGDVPEELARQVWEVAEHGDNYVFLTCQCAPSGAGCEIKAGARVMWVNLNRLVVDFFLTPEKDLSLTWSSKLLVRADERDLPGYHIRGFCPEVARPGREAAPAAETEYAAQQFGAVTGVSFLHPDDAVKPMAELANPETGMHLSAYGSFHCLQAKPVLQPGGIQLVQWADVSLKAGESFAGRVIYGIDYLHAQQETDVDEEPNPFSAFGFGL